MDDFEEATYWNVWREEQPPGWMNVTPGFWMRVSGEKAARQMMERAPKMYTKIRKQTVYKGPWEEVD